MRIFVHVVVAICCVALLSVHHIIATTLVWCVYWGDVNQTHHASKGYIIVVFLYGYKMNVKLN